MSAKISSQNEPATKGELKRVETVLKTDIKNIQVDVSQLKVDVSQLKVDMKEVKTTIVTMSQQLDWLYKRELNKQEEGLIHDNRHEEVEDKLVNHETRIVGVEKFVKLVTA
ncbi:MAG: hypothetical protein WCL07_00215 [bacterium]